MENIKNIRKKLNLTQEIFARLLTEIGYSTSLRTVVRWENGESQPSNAHMAGIRKLKRKFRLDN